jgi:hypothetical protein
MPARLIVAQEDPGHIDLCMLCPPQATDATTIPIEPLYVIAWSNDLPVPIDTLTQAGGVLRLCWQHGDELCRLLLETLA